MTKLGCTSQKTIMTNSVGRTTKQDIKKIPSILAKSLLGCLLMSYCGEQFLFHSVFNFLCFLCIYLRNYKNTWLTDHTIVNIQRVRFFNTLSTKKHLFSMVLITAYSHILSQVFFITTSTISHVHIKYYCSLLLFSIFTTKKVSLVLTHLIDNLSTMLNQKLRHPSLF